MNERVFLSILDSRIRAALAFSLLLTLFYVPFPAFAAPDNPELAETGARTAPEPDQGSDTASSIKRPDSPAAKAAAAFLGPDTIADLVDKVAPSVVNIVSISQASRAEMTRYKDQGEGGRRVRRHYGLDSSGSQLKTTGAGVLISPDGFILTSLHVVSKAESIKVTLKDGRSFDARVIGRDTFSDLCVLKIDSVGLPTVSFADSRKLRVGQWVFAIGNPFAYESSVSAGLISGLRREARNFTPAFGARTGALTFIQTDVSLNPGSSGGPLFNLRGEVVGINSFIRDEAQNIGFAIPADTAKRIGAELMSRGSAPHPYLGVEMQDAASQGGGPGLLSGVEITKVKIPSPADKAGMLAGDLIVQMDEKAVSTAADVSSFIAAHSVGDRISVKVKRSGQDKTLTVKVEALPEEFD